MTELQITYDGRSYSFQPGQVARIGRSPANDIVVGDPTVSREHAFLIFAGDGWVLEDIGQDRTFVAGRPVRRAALTAPTDIRLAMPEGPVLHAQPIAQPATDAAARRPAGPGPDTGLGAAIHILVPLKSWLSDPGWRQWSRLLVVAYGLLPAIYIVLFINASNVTTPGWAYSLYIAPLWAIAFYLLIRPGPLNKLIVVTGAGIIAGVLLLMNVLVLPWENAVNTSSTHNLLIFIYGVGYPEELAKALPVLAAALVLLIWRNVKLDVRMWMFLGCVAGLTFGVRESIEYTVSAINTAYQHPNTILAEVLTFAERVFVDGFQHAVWAGIAGFFIGIGVNYRRRRVPIILFGVTVPAVLHGLNDWSISAFADQWVWIGVQALSLALFLGYTMSATSIERQVRKSPIFRGESILLDPATSVLAPGDT